MEDRRKSKEQLLVELVELRARLAELEALEKKHRRELKKIDRDACFDPLTGLPSRTLFFNHLTQAVAHAERSHHLAAVLFCSLDRFKLINDTFDSQVGDLLLKEVAARLKDCLRKSDVLARPGRDEFMVFLPEIRNVEDSNRVVERFFASLNSPFHVRNHEIFINASVGISIYPDDGTTAEALIKSAYSAMERAREEGRSSCRFYSPDITSRAFTRLMMENSLRFALQREEFYLHYQPQIDIPTGHIIGMEALLRWNHPDLGSISPDQFIPVVEEMGLIIPLSEWVLSAACAHNKVCQQTNGVPMRMAVNLSSCQLHEKRLLKTIQRVLGESCFDPEHLEVEITEGTLVKEIDATVSILNELAGMGVSIVIDDFGKGYSSLAYLRNFPLSKLKIDRCFVDSVTTDQNNAAITRAIIALAHTLNLRVIAEGVETAGQLEFLRSLACNEGQGYLFSHPLSAQESLRLLAEKGDFDRCVCAENGNAGGGSSFWLQRMVP